MLCFYDSDTESHMRQVMLLGTTYNCHVKFYDQCINHTADDGDEVERVPGVFKKVLYGQQRANRNNTA